MSEGKKKILITGSTGFIGRNVKEYLEKNPVYRVYAPASRELDCIDEKAVQEYLEENQFDYVLHFASYGNESDEKKDATKILEYNLRMFLNFRKCSRFYGKMYYCGSGAEYDKRYDIVNVKETDIGRTIPTDQYGLMKYTVGQMIEAAENIYNFRLFGIFGKYEYYPSKFVSNICCKSLKRLPFSIRQNVYFDYLWVGDFCKMLEFFLSHKPKYHSYNMVAGDKISLREICDIVNKISFEELPVYICRDGLGREYTASNERFLEEWPDFVYTTKETAVQELYNWYKSREDMIDIYQLLYN